MTRRPFAAFDIDGTVIRWQLYHAVGDALAKMGAIGSADFERVREARMSWKRRAGEDSFRQYEEELVKVFDKELGGLEVVVVEQASEKVFEEYRDQVYTYTRDLIKSLKAQGYLLFAISGSPDTIVRKLAGYYGFDDFAATRYPTKDGRFLGTKELSLGKKPELLKALIEKHGAKQAGSIIVGDSEGDIDMLAMAERPIAFNPSKKLFQHAAAQGWKIVLERKNMVYELEPENDEYKLKR